MIFSNSTSEKTSGRKFILKVMNTLVLELGIQQLLNTINKKVTRCTYLVERVMKINFLIHGNSISRLDNGLSFAMMKVLQNDEVAIPLVSMDVTWLSTEVYTMSVKNLIVCTCLISKTKDGAASSMSSNHLSSQVQPWVRAGK